MANSVPSQQTSISKAELVGVHKEVSDLFNTVRGDMLNLRLTLGDDGTGTKGSLVGTAVKDYASLASGSQDITGTVTVTGARLGDMVDGLSISVDLQGMTFTGYVSGDDTVTCVLRNGTGGAIDLASATIRASVCPARAVDQGGMQNLLLST